MLPNERVEAVYAGNVPDEVPLMLDLSHWYKKNYNVPFDLTGFKGVDQGLVDLHKRVGAVSYVEMGSFYQIYFSDDTVDLRVWTDESGVFHTKISTPLGELNERRVFNPDSYSYGIEKFLLDSVEDFAIVEYYMERMHCRPQWEKYHAWEKELGELAYIYCQLPYSGFGFLLSRNFGVENTVFAVYDYPERVQQLVDAVNAANLRILDTIIDGPFKTLIISDNFDSNVHNPDFFERYTAPYYQEVAERVHAKGKYLAIHVDGEMKGALAGMARVGVDCIDAATPHPMFSLTPEEAREEAGPDLILSGGVPATVFGSTGTDLQFEKTVQRWLDTKKLSHRLILAAGDQVPPDAPWHRIAMLPDLVKKYGRYT